MTTETSEATAEAETASRAKLSDFISKTPEERAEVPEADRPDLDQIDAYLTERDAATRTAADAERDARDEAERKRNEARASDQTAAEWATELSRRSGSPDEAERTGALAEIARDPQKYGRALVAGDSLSDDASRVGHLEDFWSGQLGLLNEAGHSDFVNRFGDEVAKSGGFAMALIEEGIRIGKLEGAEENDQTNNRQDRADRGAGGAKNMGSASGGSGGRRRAGQYGNQEWVEQQKRDIPNWAQLPAGEEKDDYGRPITNGRMALRALSEARRG